MKGKVVEILSQSKSTVLCDIKKVEMQTGKNKLKAALLCEYYLRQAAELVNTISTSFQINLLMAQVGTILRKDDTEDKYMLMKPERGLCLELGNLMNCWGAQCGTLENQLPTRDVLGSGVEQQS